MESGSLTLLRREPPADCRSRPEVATRSWFGSKKWRLNLPSSLMTFRGKSFWIHNSVAEVWFAAFMREVASEAGTSEWNQSMLDDLAPALEHGWVDGILMGAFDKHLTSDQRLEAFLPRMARTNSYLRSAAVPGDVVVVGRFCASKDYLLPQIERLQDLFLRPQVLSEPWEIFTVPGGWRAA